MHIDSLIRRIGRRQRSTFQEAKRNSLSGAEAPSFMKKNLYGFPIGTCVRVPLCQSICVCVFAPETWCTSERERRYRSVFLGLLSVMRKQMRLLNVKNLIPFFGAITEKPLECNLTLL